MISFLGHCFSDKYERLTPEVHVHHDEEVFECSLDIKLLKYIYKTQTYQSIIGWF